MEEKALCSNCWHKPRFAMSVSHKALRPGPAKRYVSGFSLAFETTFTSGENASMKCLFPLGRGRCGPCTQATYQRTDVRRCLLSSLSQSPWLPRGCSGGAGGAAPLLLRHGVMSASGQARLRSGTKKGCLSASSVTSRCA